MSPVKVVREDGRSEAITKLVADLMGDVTRLFATDSLDGGDLMLWADEQRGIGELMIVERADAPPTCLGYASFIKDPKLLEPWLNSLADRLFSSFAPSSQRLRLLNWVLAGLVTQLDEEKTYSDAESIARAREEIGALDADGVSTGSWWEVRLKAHLAQLSWRPT
jgi:hypothetical protein